MSEVEVVTPDAEAPVPAEPETKSLYEFAADLRTQAARQGGMNPSGLSMMEAAAVFECTGMVVDRLDEIITLLKQFATPKWAGTAEDELEGADIGEPGDSST